MDNKMAMGRIPDYPDFQDCTEESEEIRKILKPTGALLIRNSRGKDWGDAGYGWLPYESTKKGLAEDFWSILKKEWVDTGEFRI